MGTRLAIAAALALAAAAPPARADEPAPPPGSPAARADALFQEGVALRANDPAAACAKFEESRALNPAAIGVLLNLAKCAKDAGKTATAVARYRAVIDRAQEAHDDKFEGVAQSELDVLEPLVPHLAISFAESPIAGTQLVVDSDVVSLDGAGNLAVDPGEREITVSAPRRIPFHAKVTVAPSERKTVEIPALAKSIIVTSSRRRIGLLTGIAGVAMVGTGVGLGLYARHLYNAQFDGPVGNRCDRPGEYGADATPPNPHYVDHVACDGDAYTKLKRAHTIGNVGTIVGGVGLAAIGVGALLWFTAPHTERPDGPAVTIGPSITPTSAGLTAVGRF
jgi:hypothetical protein